MFLSRVDAETTVMMCSKRVRARDIYMKTRLTMILTLTMPRPHNLQYQLRCPKLNNTRLAGQAQKAVPSSVFLRATIENGVSLVRAGRVGQT